MSKILTTRLNSDPEYRRPTLTIQDQYTREDIAKKLQGYKKVDKIENIPIDTHIRYILIDKETNEHKFRTGGFLKRKDNADKYIILSNGTKTWTVQVKDSLFFRKMSHEEEIQEIEDYYEEEIKKLKKEIKKLKKELDKKN